MARLTRKQLSAFGFARNGAPVLISDNTRVYGRGTGILPGVTLFEGAAAVALCLLNIGVAAFSIVANITCLVIKTRSRHLLQLTTEFQKTRLQANCVA
jgi:acetyltransferase-like isoleucine patch superfamily enzyme